MKKIGKYEILGLLGKGGMGTVYKVRLPVVNKIVALKWCTPHPYLIDSLGEAEIVRRFTSEAATMAALHHPNVVDILDFDSANSRPFFTMEYYYQNLGMILGEGARLETPSRRLSLDKALHYTRQILLGLSRMHRAGIVHRDIKPYNLFITLADRLKISDLGLSKLRGEHASPHRSNVMVGSPYYAAPEQEKDPEAVDPRADIYSTGVVLYRMLTGRLPEEAAPRPSEWRPDCDGAWDALVRCALQPEREKRFESAARMLDALDRVQADWEERKRAVCRMHPARLPNPAAPDGPAARLRDRPLKVLSHEAPELFACDALFYPRSITQNAFLALESGCESVVRDQATGLEWQQSGSEDPLSWQEAQEYVSRLNNGLSSGEPRRWRLPTVSELFSLLRPPGTREEEQCIESVFDRSKKWLWSSDRASFLAAWYVDTELGYANRADSTCRFYVRAVRHQGVNAPAPPCER